MRLINPNELEQVLRPILTDESCPLHIAAEIDMNIDLMPKVDAVPVRYGRWKHKKDLKQFFCDQCGEPSLTEDDVYFYGMEFPNFCHNCGARMDGKDEGDE